MANENLTDKQRAFCEEYLIDFNATQAAIRAGYSPKTARVTAAEYLAKPNIQNYLTELKAERAERVQISQDDVLKELKHIAFDNISNYLEFRTEKVVADVVDGHNIYSYKTIVDIKDSNTIDTRNVQEVSIGANGAFKFKLYGKDEALSLLGRHLGMFKDKVEMEVKDSKAQTELREYLRVLKQNENTGHKMDT